MPDPTFTPSDAYIRATIRAERQLPLDRQNIIMLDFAEALLREREAVEIVEKVRAILNEDSNEPTIDRIFAAVNGPYPDVPPERGSDA